MNFGKPFNARAQRWMMIMPSGHGYEPGCKCSYCKHGPPGSRRGRTGGRRSNRGRGGWSPRVQGTTGDDHDVTLREGLGDNDGHTIISDGHVSGPEFDVGHNHYGDKREGGGRVEDDGDRGYYTGPGR